MPVLLDHLVAETTILLATVCQSTAYHATSVLRFGRFVWPVPDARAPIGVVPDANPDRLLEASRRWRAAGSGKHLQRRAYALRHRGDQPPATCATSCRQCYCSASVVDFRCQRS